MSIEHMHHWREESIMSKSQCYVCGLTVHADHREWQPMDTAPEECLVATAHFPHGVHAKQGEISGWYTALGALGDEGWQYLGDPWGWMPLPPACTKLVEPQ